jgi:hypothetical protein
MKNRAKSRNLTLVMVILLISIFFSGADASFICGDANGDGKINLLDVSYMINTLYRHGAPSVPPAAADPDNSTKLNLLDISFLISFLYRGGLNPVCPGDTASGGIIKTSACKVYFEEMALSQSSATNCFTYDYDGAGVLDIRHLDALLNCGPFYWGRVAIYNDTIAVTECWTGGYRCTCTFDLDYRISNLVSGSYHIIFNLDNYDWYHQAHDIYLNFEADIDLVVNPSDSVCVP